MSEEINLNDLLVYHHETGTLTWKERGMEWFSSSRSRAVWNAKYAGKKAGSVHTDNTGRKCIHVSINNRKYKGHRICWELINGPIPDGMTIDHIDHNPLNNKISNLRLASQVEQKRNMPIQKNNSSGVVGVGWWIGPYISRHFLSLNPLLVLRRRYSRGERYPSALCGCHSL
ncbi:HNH endonuclease signature motif containing protein [Serratia marcescens]|uniref:HNH endonuclease signature motif containing protein n=1 Tax=Serratia marcescens TaxID=615 RepID=UPI000E033414|nr:Uncharacterised protein [Serratia marcescens]